MNLFTYNIAKEEYSKLKTKKAFREFFDKINDQLVTDKYLHTNYLFSSNVPDIDYMTLKLLNEIIPDFRENNIPLPAGIDRRLQACTAHIFKDCAIKDIKMPDIGTRCVTTDQMQNIYNSKLWYENLLPAWVYEAIDEYYHKGQADG